MNSKAHEVRSIGTLLLFKKDFCSPACYEDWNVGITDHVHLLLPRGVTIWSMDLFSIGPVVVAL